MQFECICTMLKIQVQSIASPSNGSAASQWSEPTLLGPGLRPASQVEVVKHAFVLLTDASLQLHFIFVFNLNQFALRS